MPNWPLSPKEAEDKELEELAVSMPPEYLNLLRALSDGEYVYPIAGSARRAGMTVKEARPILKEFIQKRMVHFVHLTEVDGDRLMGSGYWRTRRGSRVLTLLNVCPTYEEDY